MGLDVRSLGAGTHRFDKGSYTEEQFVGDVKTYKMRHVYHSAEDGTVEVTTEVAPFRVLEEDPAPKFTRRSAHGARARVIHTLLPPHGVRQYFTLTTGGRTGDVL